MRARRHNLGTESGLRTMAAVGVLCEKVLKPILAKACQSAPEAPVPPENRSPLENHYEAIQEEVQKLLQTLKTSA